MKKSKLAILLKEELLLAHKKMSPQERMKAFFAHSQLLMRLFELGKAYHKHNSRRIMLLNSGKKRIK